MHELEYITYKAMIECTEGEAPGLFTPTYNTTTKINSCLVSTKVDKIPITNIPDFVVCKKGGKCTPAPTEWLDTYPVKVKGQQTLIGKSCNMCGKGGTIKFMTSGQVPLTAEEEAQLNDMREGVEKAYEKEQEEKNKPWWKKAGEFVVDCVPVVGPIVSMAKNISEGNWGMALLDVGFLALDVVGVVGAPFTGGASLAGSTAVKIGARQAIKAGAKQVMKQGAKQAAEAAAKQAAEMLQKLSVRNMTRGKLCVFACFPAGTPIAIKDGLKNIEDIGIGDEVWAYDEKTGNIGLKKVIKTGERLTNILVEVTIDNEQMHVTPNHPYYINGEWKEAGLLEVGDGVMLFSGRLGKVENVAYKYDEQLAEITKRTLVESLGGDDESNYVTSKVFNFEVEGWHTYFVGASKFLVHNGVCDDAAEAAAKKIDELPAGTFRDSKGKLRNKDGTFAKDPKTVDYNRSKAERKKALLRDAKDPNSGLSPRARKQILDSNGNNVPKGHEVSHDPPLYTGKTKQEKAALDKAENMKTMQKAKHRKQHRKCGSQYHEYPM